MINAKEIGARLIKLRGIFRVKEYQKRLVLAYQLLLCTKMGREYQEMI